MESTYYWLNDQPAAPLVLSPVRNGEPIDLEPYTGGTGQLLWPDGTTTAATVTLEDDAVAVQLPQLTYPGVAWLTIALTGAQGVSDRLDGIPIIVQLDDGWLTLPLARSQWIDAPADDYRLYLLLLSAKFDCIAYAPALPAGARPPLTWQLAQLSHARNKQNAGAVDPGGSAGGQDFTLTPFPLDWSIKQVLRPQRRAMPL